MSVYITRNPYEWIRYVAYIFLAISFVSMVWNHCNERNVYTRTWRSSFILGSSTAIVYALLKLNNIRQCQPWISTENLFHELEIAYISATICLWSVVAVEYWAQRQNTLHFEKIRRRVFYSICLLLLAIGLTAFWQLHAATIEVQLALCGAHQQISQLYELFFCCLIFTEGGYRKWQRRVGLFGTGSIL